MTLNNYTSTEVEQLNALFRIHTKRFIFQEETGEEGTPHLQGAFVLNKTKYLQWLKNNINKRAHFEPMNNEAASFDYCSKPETRTGSIYKNEDFLKLDEPFYEKGIWTLWSVYRDDYFQIFEKNHSILSGVEPILFGKDGSPRGLCWFFINEPQQKELIC